VLEQFGETEIRAYPTS